MSESRKVYIRPSVFFAFIDRAHPKHTQATGYFRYFGQEKYSVFTDSMCIISAYTQIYEKISPSLAKDFLRSMWIGNINILIPEESELKAALKALVTYRSTELTFPEAISAVLANRNSISSICTFDYLHPLFGQTLFYLPI